MVIQQVRVVAPLAMVVKQNDGPGTQSGNSGTSDTEGSGYFDVSGYRASLDANKVMPAQAVRRGITGTVTIRVYFDGEVIM